MLIRFLPPSPLAPRSPLFPYTTLFRSDVPRMVPGREVEYLYWVGCSASYDKRNQAIARAVVKILKAAGVSFGVMQEDRKSTRLNSSHRCISYAVFCLKKKKKQRYRLN